MGRVDELGGGTLRLGFPIQTLTAKIERTPTYCRKPMQYRSLATTPTEGVTHNPAICKQVMLRPNEVPALTNFSQARFAPGLVAAGHAHSDMYEVFFVEAGQGTITIDGTPYGLSPGVCVMVELGEVHEVANTGTAELVLTYFGIRSA